MARGTIYKVKPIVEYRMELVNSAKAMLNFRYLTQSISRGLLVVSLVALPVCAGKLLPWQSLLATAIILVAATIWMLGTLSIRELLRPNLIDVALALLLVAALVSLVRSVYLHDSLVAIGQLASYLLVFWLCQDLGKSQRWRSAALVAVIVGGTVAAIWGLREYMQTVVASGETTWRIFGPFYNPNLLAGHLLLVLPVAAAFLWGWAQRDRHPGYGLRLVGGIFVVALLAAALLLTGSKGGLLAAVAVVVVLAVTLPEPGTATARKMRWLAGAGLVLGAVVALMLPPIRIRLLSAFGSESHSWMFRLLTWRGALSMIAARPLLGFGPGSFQYAYPSFAEAGFTRMAHQSFLQIGAETGIPSLAALLVAFGALIAGLVRRLRAAPAAQRPLIAAAIAATVGFLLHNLVDYSWYSPAIGITMWALLGLALSTGPARREMGKPGVALVSVARLAILVAMIAALAGAVLGLTGQSLAADARGLARQGSYQAAIQQVRRALRCDPLNAELCEDLANYEAAQVPRKGRQALVAAIKARLEVARLRPTEPTNYRYLAELYAQARDFSSAIAAARRAVQQYPSGVESWVVLAKIYEQSDSRAQAEASYRQVVAIYHSPVRKYDPVREFSEPTYAYAWYFLANQAASQGDRPQEYLYLATAAKVLTQYLREIPLRRQMLKLVGAWNEAEYQELRHLSADVVGRLVASSRFDALMRAGELYLARDEPRKAQAALEQLSAEAAEGKRLAGGEKLFTGRGLVSLAGLLEKQNDSSKVRQQGLSLLKEGLDELAEGRGASGWEEDDTQVVKYILGHHQLPGPPGRMGLVGEGTQ